MKNILVICSNIIVAFQIKSHYLNVKNDNKYIFFIEKNNYTEEIINIFKSFKYKEIYKLNPIEQPIYFNLIRLYNFNKIRKYNNQLQNKLKKVKRLKNILNREYSEVCFSNDNLSKLILYKKRILKKYFSHSLTDFLIHYKYLNIFTYIKRIIEDYINNNFFHINKPSSRNTKIYCIFDHFRKKKLLYSIDKNKFKNIFLENINFKKKKLFQNKKINLINISIPYAYYKKKYPNKILKNYVDFFQNQILNKILINSSEVYIFKFKESIPKNIQKKIINKFQVNFKNFVIILYTKKNTGTNSLEKFVYSYNVKSYFSNFSSSMFFTKLIKPKIKIYNFSDRIDNYWKDKQSLLFKNHRQNQSNLLKLVNQYKKIWTNI
jgi:hypothetical protein